MNILLPISLLFELIAFGAMEIAIILPVLTFSFALIFSKQKHIKQKIIESARRNIPFFILTVVYWALRAWVLKTLLGGGEEKNIGDVLKLLVSAPADYFGSLVYPVHFLSFVIPNTIQFFSIAALFAFIGVVIWQRAAFLNMVRKQLTNSNYTILFIKALALFLSVTALVGLVLHPLFLKPIYGLIEKAYNGNGPKFLVHAIKGQRILSVESYFKIVKNLFLNGILTILVASVVFLYFCVIPSEKIREFLSTQTGKLCLFLIIWLFLPFLILLVTGSDIVKHLYIPVVPFSMLISMGISESFQAIKKAGGDIRRLSSRIAFFTILVIITISYLIYSPLITKYNRLKDNATVSLMFFEKLRTIVPNLPADSHLIIDFPEGISENYYAKIPHEKAVHGLADHSIKSWLDLNFPNNELSVSIKPSYRLENLPLGIKVDVIPVDQGTKRYRIITRPIKE